MLFTAVPISFNSVKKIKMTLSIVPQASSKQNCFDTNIIIVHIYFHWYQWTFNAYAKN